jgi:signal peptidase I
MREKLFFYLKENRFFLIFVLFMLVFRSSIADWNSVPTGSMKPTILEGDRIWVDKLAYDLHLPFTHISLMKFADPERGDIVIFDSHAADKRLVKRVIGLPGDVVAMRDNRLWINGQGVEYSKHLNTRTADDRLEDLGGDVHWVRWQGRDSVLANFSPVVIPDGHYLVLGDNRNNSADSRVIGFVPRDEIVGRSRYVVMSLNYDNYYLPRSERFFWAL